MLHELNHIGSIDAGQLMSDESSDEHHSQNGIIRSPIELAKDVTSKLLDQTLANASLFHPHGSSNGTSVIDLLDMEFVPLARAHWLLLQQQTGSQTNICKNMIINVLLKYPQMRPIWNFSKILDYDSVTWQEDMQKDNRFRHHCASVQAGITMIMDNLDDMHGMAKLLREIGAHHFFYDANEPHFELMHEGFMFSLNMTHGPLDEDVVRGWDQFWTQLKTSIGYGISIQRQTYLKECVTSPEMTSVRLMWDNVRDYGLEHAGQKMVEYALQTYQQLITKHKINYPVHLPTDCIAFKVYSEQVINALDTTIDSYTPEKGFQYLPKQLKGFVTQCLMIDVCPTLIRKSFMDGLIKVLTDIHGENNMTEVTVHTWSKIYRILEQAIIWNIVHY